MSVISYTKARIDSLLGGKADVSAITALVVINGSNAATARPTTALPVIWFGSVQPTAFADGDVFVTVTAG